MNVINNITEPRKVLICDIPVGRPFLDHNDDLFICCSFEHAVEVRASGLYRYALMVLTGDIVSFHHGTNVTPVQAQAVIQARAKDE